MKVCHTFLCTFIAKEILLNRSGFEQLKLNPEYLKFYKKKNLNNLFITFRFTKKKKHLSNFPNLIPGLPIFFAALQIHRDERNLKSVTSDLEPMTSQLILVGFITWLGNLVEVVPKQLSLSQFSLTIYLYEN